MRWAAGVCRAWGGFWWLPGQQWASQTYMISGNSGSCEQGIFDVIVKFGGFHRIWILLVGSERYVCCSWSPNLCFSVTFFWDELGGFLQTVSPWHMKAALGQKDKYSEAFFSALDAMHLCTLAVKKQLEQTHCVWTQVCCKQFSVKWILLIPGSWRKKLDTFVQSPGSELSLAKKLGALFLADQSLANP